MYFLFKMGIFHCYVCLPEGIHVLVSISYHPLDTLTTYNSVVIPCGIVASKDKFLLMDSEPKYQDVSKFLRLGSAKWSIMQQIAGCAMPFLDKSDWIDSTPIVCRLLP